MDLKIEMRKAPAAGPACIVKNGASALRRNLTIFALHTRNNDTTFAQQARCECATSSLSEHLASSVRVASREICAMVARHHGINDTAKRGRICAVPVRAKPVQFHRTPLFAPTALNGHPALRGRTATAAEVTP